MSHLDALDAGDDLRSGITGGCSSASTRRGAL